MRAFNHKISFVADLLKCPRDLTQQDNNYAMYSVAQAP